MFSHMYFTMIPAFDFFFVQYLILVFEAYTSTLSGEISEFLQERQGDIFTRHQEVGFILACDGSEDHLLKFRDGNF